MWGLETNASNLGIKLILNAQTYFLKPAVLIRHHGGIPVSMQVCSCRTDGYILFLELYYFQQYRKGAAFACLRVSLSCSQSLLIWAIFEGR